MQHVKYSSIENTYRDKFLQMLRDEGKDDGEWIVMEKVHGAQFSFYYDGNEMLTSSRTAFITEEMDFFNWQKVMADNRDNIIDLYERAKKNHDGFSLLVVYGELFGGSYPHNDVPKAKGAKRLQKGVHYHPDNLFYAFDIKVDGRYLGVDENEPFV